MPDHLEVSHAAELISLGGFKDRRGETIITLLFPGCGSMEHEVCMTMAPRIGTKDRPRKWLGWYHCSCDCHKFTETDTGWNVERAK